MKVAINELSPSEVEMIFTFEPEEVQPVLSDVINRYKVNAFLPGFRKGKAPVSLIKRKFWDSIKQDVVTKLVKDEYTKKLDEFKIDPVAPGHIDYDNLELKENAPLELKILIMREPVIEVVGYKELVVEEPEIKVSKAEVDKVVNSYREQLAELKDAPADKEAMQGDTANVSVKGYVNGKNLKELNNENLEFEIGKNQVITELEDSVKGLRQGETASFVLKYPKDYEHKLLAGKEVEYKVELKALKEKVYPELTKEVLKKLGDYEDEKDLRKKVKEDISNYKKEMAKRDAKVQILDSLIEKNEFEVPSQLVEQELAVMLSDEEARLQQQGLSLKQLNIDINELRERWRGEAEARAKASVILKNIARMEGIEVTDEDIDNEIERIAKKQGYDAEQLKKVIKARKDLDSFRQQVLEEKVINFLYENAEKKKKKPSKKKED